MTNKENNLEKELRIGVVGYCPPTKFDEVAARQYVQDAYNKIEKDFPDYKKTVVSGLTNVGVLKHAYEEAVSRGYKTAGVACKEAEKYECFPVDEKIIIGSNWGDESPTFLKTIDALVRIGGGKQSHSETTQAKKMGKPVYEYELAVLE